MKIVIIEDEKSIIDAITVAFEFRWPEVSIQSATKGYEGVDLVRREPPDIVLLDVNLPDISGFEVLKQIRAFSAVPVIIITVRSEDADVLRGLEAGADDYITKPFNYLTLMARVKTVLRRAGGNRQNSNLQTIEFPRLSINLLNQKVSLDKKLIELTPNEYRLLVLLAKNNNQIVSFQDIMREIWQANYTGDSRKIRIYIQRLRKKLNDNPARMILNQRSQGYVFKG